jgi:hypothetical protein
MNGLLLLAGRRSILCLWQWVRFCKESWFIWNIPHMKTTLCFFLYFLKYCLHNSILDLDFVSFTRSCGFFFNCISAMSAARWKLRGEVSCWNTTTNLISSQLLNCYFHFWNFVQKFSIAFRCWFNYCSWENSIGYF